MKKKALYILNKGSFSDIYSKKEQNIIDDLMDVYAKPQTASSIKENPDILNDVEIIMSGWGCPTIDKQFLDYAPNLKAIFYGAGSIKKLATDEMWDRGIILTSSWVANAMPVAEYTIASIFYCLKNAFRHNREYTALKDNSHKKSIPVLGAFRTTIGIISLGIIARRVCELLKSFDMNVIAYDPYVTQAQANELNVTMVSLDEIFKKSDIVSLHTPWLPETENMITGKHFEMMKPNSSFINTARGAIIKENEMIEVLTKRQDIQAVIDVTYPEPPSQDSLLFTLENVFITPHIAGSMNMECNRMGEYAVNQLKKYLNNEPLEYQITQEMAKNMA